MNIEDFKGKMIHMSGIGGSSMSGLAEMLLKEGYTLRGSDNTRSHAVERLEKMGIPVAIGHQKENVHGAALYVYSAAILPDNPERVEAEKLGIPQMERSVLLGEVMRGHKENICVCGAHGKTSTSSMIAQMLLAAGLDPTVHIGGRLDAIGGGTRIGKKDVFVAEACEFHRSFLELHPTIAVVLNIDADHLDCYKDIDEIEETFGQFLGLVPETGTAVGLGEDARVMRRFAKLKCHTVTFGLSRENDYYPTNLNYQDRGRGEFDVIGFGETIGHVKLAVAGEFQVLNALASIAACTAAGADPKTVCDELSRFSGAHRRFEKTGTIDGADMYHDYGHNPAEMRAAVSVACMQGAKRVFAVMQPHTYSRVKALFDDYLTCTKQADVTLVTDIFAAREKDPGDIHTSMLIEGMRKNGVNCVYTPTFDDCEKYLRENMHKGDLVLTMGCGNINLLNEQMQAHGDTAGKE